MGTGAVYVCLAGLEDHPGLSIIRTIFFFLNIALFALNTMTLSIQLLCESCHLPDMLKMTMCPEY